MPKISPTLPLHTSYGFFHRIHAESTNQRRIMHHVVLLKNLPFLWMLEARPRLCLHAALPTETSPSETLRLRWIRIYWWFLLCFDSNRAGNPAERTPGVQCSLPIVWDLSKCLKGMVPPGLSGFHDVVINTHHQ